MKVEELGPRSRKVDLVFRVVSLGEERTVTSRRDGSEHRLVEATVGDETGTVIMTLWDDDIETVEEGNTYKLENGYTNVFKGSLRLNSGRYGEIKEVDEEIKVNEKNNISEKELGMGRY